LPIMISPNAMRLHRCALSKFKEGELKRNGALAEPGPLLRLLHMRRVRAGECTF